jgi:ABC-type transport system involved in cytochrome bd biosynthesis fused ATPase/permease subunit
VNLFLSLLLTFIVFCLLYFSIRVNKLDLINILFLKTYFYNSQEPWTFAGSVRENVLFGSPFDEEKYKKVLHVCALEKDLQLFPHGIL